ncbi:MAG: MgtC/SapB family protein [Actinomycetota bacterium]
MVLRLAVAALLGGLIGLEREFSDQPAGLRTHLLVALGAALFTLTGAYGLAVFAGGAEDAVRIDPTRVAAQIVTGIGFLGAGAIIQQGFSVRGLTTAAALWVTAAVGMAVAFGYMIGAVFTSVIAIVALYGLKRLERVLFPKIRADLRRSEEREEP